MDIPKKLLIGRYLINILNFRCIVIYFYYFLSYLSIGDPKNAISSLVKVKQIRELTLAARISKNVDEAMEQSLVINILKMEYFKHHKWNDAKELLKNHPKLDVCSTQFILTFSND